ncbi:hypothetical protein HBH50_041440 [Parastagonospora nodorum]|nr:hypothetical protein HBH50_041440 [Parastagonospora nodorum]KAH4091545.1 hypothetical protein HBH48_093760 [Parastagonospora nodorum]
MLIYLSKAADYYKLAQQAYLLLVLSTLVVLIRISIASSFVSLPIFSRGESLKKQNYRASRSLRSHYGSFRTRILKVNVSYKDSEHYCLRFAYTYSRMYASVS